MAQRNGSYSTAFKNLNDWTSRIDIAEVPSESLDVPIPKIVSENEHDIRSIICCSNEAQKAAGDENKESRSNLHALGYAKI